MRALLSELSSAASESGLALRGGFAPTPPERVGPLAEARTVLLFGFVGARQWPTFAASAEAADGQPHPLDRWSRRVLCELGERFAATPLFPFEGPPYWPFQAWAKRAEPVFASPLGLLIHAEYGLWHSYRGALAFGEAILVEAAPPPPASPSPRSRTASGAWEADGGERTTISPCERCEGKPCLSACPVGAFSTSGYDVGACADWLRSPGGDDCINLGCRARRACPVGQAFHHEPGQARFHMAAFLAARG